MTTTDEGHASDLGVYRLLESYRGRPDNQVGELASFHGTENVMMM